MTTTKLHYVRRVRGNLFWAPNKAMRKAGFLAKPLGPESAASVAEAKRLYEQWMQHRQAPPKVTTWPPGTFGAYYDRFTGRYTGKPVKRWRDLKARSREDFDRAWVHLGPAFGAKIPTKISVSEVEDFAEELEENVSPSERYRTMKCFRALFSDMIKRLRLKIISPAHAVKNPQPKGRSEIWLGQEIAHLVRTADALGYHGMALAIDIAWDTLFAPVDIWTAVPKMLKSDPQGSYLERPRTKTDAAAFGSLSKATAEKLAAYMEGLPMEFTPITPMIRQRNGQAYRSKDTFGDDFRAVRAVAFPSDRRQFMDIRRSGNVEADIGGADKETMGELLANTIASSNFLDATYTPPTVSKARKVAELRLVGRDRLKTELERVSTVATKTG